MVSIVVVLGLGCRAGEVVSPEREPEAAPPVIIESETYTHAEAELAGEVLVSSFAWFHAHPDSEIRYVLANKKVFRLKEDLGTDPKFWYFMD